MAQVGGKRIVNLVTQERIGTDQRQVDYEALYTSLNTLRRVLESARDEGRIYRLAVPWLSCGLAGGSTKVVGAMIEEIFGNSPIVCTVVGYVQPAKKKAVELPKELEAIVQTEPILPDPSTTTSSTP